MNSSKLIIKTDDMWEREIKNLEDSLSVVMVERQLARSKVQDLQKELAEAKEKLALYEERMYEQLERANAVQNELYTRNNELQAERAAHQTDCQALERAEQRLAEVKVALPKETEDPNPSSGIYTEVELRNALNWLVSSERSFNPNTRKYKSLLSLIVRSLVKSNHNPYAKKNAEEIGLSIYQAAVDLL